MTATVVQFQKNQEAKFICSACGADRGCQCKAPAVEKFAALTEQRRQARRTYDEKKRQEKQSASDIRNGLGREGKSRKVSAKSAPTEEEMPTEEEAEASYQETLYDQACLLLERMADKTRQRFFAHIEKVYK